MTILVLLAVLTVVPVLLSFRLVPLWMAPTSAIALLTAVTIISVNMPRTHGYLLAATAALTITAAGIGGMPLAPAAFHIARRQPDTGGPLLDVRGGPLHGGRMVGILERTAVAASVLSGWPEGMAIVLAIKSLARYPDLRDSKVSEQFIIGTFTSVLWAVAVAALGRHLVLTGPWPPVHEPGLHIRE